MRWSAGAYTGVKVSALAAISCLLGSACDGDSNRDVSGAYELALDDGNVHALLYLFRSPDDEYLAVLDHSRCTVDRAEGELHLSGCSLLVPGLPGQFENIAANYVSFSLGRDASGALATLSAFDQENDLRAEGKLERSRHAPLLRGGSAPSSPPSSARPRLPWDAFVLDFGVGVLMDETTVSESMDVEASGGDPVEARWSYRTFDVPQTSRRLVMSASATLNWPDLLGQQITFSLPAGTPDSVGKTMSNVMEVDFQVPRVAAAARAWELDQESELARNIKWGNLMSVRETSLCPGSCLQTGPRISACQEPGLAGQLDAREASKLVVRVRTVANQRLVAALELAITVGEPGTPDGGRSSSRELLLARGLQQDTDFRELEVPLSAAQRRDKLPVELRLVYGCSGGTTGNAVPAEATVLIDRIAVE